MRGIRGRGLFGVLLLLAAPTLGAQTAPPDAESQVMKVVDELFVAMRAADSATVRTLFHPELEKMASSFLQRDGTPVVRFGDLEGFANSVGAAAPGDFDERLGRAEIHMHDNLATVFTPYAFYLKEQLSHCGVNVFLIARTGDDWKIVGLADTRRRQDCEEWLP
ncbi:MAG: nuclear transport factor 2 family protein [marine benthic group bacterium]|nr:nuclear transport factor 2 family protein [Gemmatimonadota bacterium]